jgi:hypothetical protein
MVRGKKFRLCRAVLAAAMDGERPRWMRPAVIVHPTTTGRLVRPKFVAKGSGL